MGKDEAATRYGEERIGRWRSSYGAGPPAIQPEDPRYLGHDARYALLARDELPLAESPEDVSGRLIPYWSGVIAPTVKDGERALVKHL
jgi:2,3-bisphosphoglycerate-dependent phosphoglycerate mutase